ncbi:type-F conjugative transfer system pilin assembly protein TrbC [Vibrio parahaemolyticus]|uniref:type-F conjugative transfer system pilin assembly protein TrbC n=1 Tax=Vibrio parahaemolyticus TaxID=670 RepID=UPI001B831C27|nr:type-F conjugative transfer system pilin assembly protein TrbC [Vibrio parahaemolyticus]UJW96474.1 type-F conjugative transfer system pilin assembly protein TrbC [Vibrio parahaemolyticus]HBB9944288.1 type-F conjugative transfer system pilin assembly protein TrbC [Vibrio parahaemolyticus]HBC3416759.1 type-F conjugative transfer system pilin assembly protein TrbC [Vibrio parahaemolyticus]HBC3602241.1 type-F conjugative transfer system pilin assembly protein TrbC [Vibrio parahaemolyticus]HBC38
MKHLQSLFIGSLTLFFSQMTFASIGYTQNELKALAKLEQQTSSQAPSLQTQQDIETQQQTSTQFIEYARQQARQWQEKLDPNSLQGIIDTPTPTENPNAAPTGVMVFVSLTMPKSSLKALLKQSEIWQVPLVIRGVLPDGFTATANTIQSLLQTNEKKPINSGFAISPEWFQTFNIQEVPTFVAVKPGRCLPKQPCSESDYDIVKGNVSLPDALEHLAKGDNPDVVRQVLQRRKQ